MTSWQKKATVIFLRSVNDESPDGRHEAAEQQDSCGGQNNDSVTTIVMVMIAIIWNKNIENRTTAVTAVETAFLAPRPGRSTARTAAAVSSTPAGGSSVRSARHATTVLQR